MYGGDFVAKNSNFSDYEYDDEEFYLKQQQRKAQRMANEKRNINSQNKAVVKNPNASNQYKNLVNRTGKNLSNDVKAYYPDGQAANANRNVYQNRQQSHTQYRYEDLKQQRNVKTNNPVVTRKPKKKKGKIRKTIRGIVVATFAIYFAVTAYLFSIVSNLTYNEQDRAENSFVSASTLEKSFYVENILFVGVDSRGEENSRSDTMMLVSIDKKNKKIKLTSFLRDTYVTVPGQGDMKLNAACFYGGPKLVMDTIEYNFGINIDHYILVDFETFRGIIDAVGGVDVDITESEAEYLRDTVKIPYIVEGHNHLNGGATLWYCRIRYLDSDFNRTERQRKVISSILNSVKHQNPFKLVDKAKEVLPYIETDMTPLKITLLSEMVGLFYMRYDIVQQQIPYDGEYEDRYINDQLVLYIDLESTSKKIKNFIYE